MACALAALVVPRMSVIAAFIDLARIVAICQQRSATWDAFGANEAAYLSAADWAAHFELTEAAAVHWCEIAFWLRRLGRAYAVDVAVDDARLADTIIRFLRAARPTRDASPQLVEPWQSLVGGAPHWHVDAPTHAALALYGAAPETVPRRNIDVFTSRALEAGMNRFAQSPRGLRTPVVPVPHVTFAQPLSIQRTAWPLSPHVGERFLPLSEPRLRSPPRPSIAPVPSPSPALAHGPRNHVNGPSVSDHNSITSTTRLSPAGDMSATRGPPRLAAPTARRERMRVRDDPTPAFS
jgi:hypothetical protein